MKRYALGGFFAAGMVVMTLGCGNASALPVLSEWPSDSSLAATSPLPAPQGARSPASDAGLWLDEIAGPHGGDASRPAGGLPHGIGQYIDPAPVLYLFEAGTTIAPPTAEKSPMDLEALGHSLRGAAGIDTIPGPTLTVGPTGAHNSGNVEDWLFELRYVRANGQQDPGPAPLIPVPEPAASSLLLLGAAGLAIRNRMR